MLHDVTISVNQPLNSLSALVGKLHKVIQLALMTDCAHSHTQSLINSSIPINIYLWTDTCKYYQWLSFYAVNIPHPTKFIIIVIQKVDIKQKRWLQTKVSASLVWLYFIILRFYDWITIYANFVEKTYYTLTKLI